MKVITSTYYLLMRFLTKEGVKEVRDDKTIARKCYVASLKWKESKETLIINYLEDREDT